MTRRPALAFRSMRRPLAAGVGALYFALAILAHFAHEAPAQAAETLDPLGLGAPICWGADAPAPEADGRGAPVCEACLLAKSLCAPPPVGTPTLAAPSLAAAALVLVRAESVGAATPAPTPPVRGPPARH